MGRGPCAVVKKVPRRDRTVGSLVAMERTFHVHMRRESGAGVGAAHGGTGGTGDAGGGGEEGGEVAVVVGGGGKGGVEASGVSSGYGKPTSTSKGSLGSWYVANRTGSQDRSAAKGRRRRGSAVKAVTRRW